MWLVMTLVALAGCFEWVYQRSKRQGKKYLNKGEDDLKK